MNTYSFEGIATTHFGKPLLQFESLPSTNDYAKEFIGTLSHGTAVVAACQTSGKGTKGRTWAADSADNIYLSIVFKQVVPQALGVLPLLCGLAGVQALSREGIAHCGIKWPNDLVLGGKKIAGILCESVVQGANIGVVCGIGINCNQSASTFERNGLPHATSLYVQTGQKQDLNAVAGAFLEELERLYEEFCQNGLVPRLKAVYEANCITLDKEVLVTVAGETKQGFALGISADGSLLCNIDGAVCTVRHGDSSVRGLFGYV